MACKRSSVQVRYPPLPGLIQAVEKQGFPWFLLGDDSFLRALCVPPAVLDLVHGFLARWARQSAVILTLCRLRATEPTGKGQGDLSLQISWLEKPLLSYDCMVESFSPWPIDKLKGISQER